MCKPPEWHIFKGSKLGLMARKAAGVLLFNINPLVLAIALEKRFQQVEFRRAGI